jgi:hypothetical protein
LLWFDSNFGQLASFVIFIVVFLIIETKKKEPTISYWMFKARLFAASQILTVLYGTSFVILPIIIPIFVLAVYGGSATIAGFILTPLMIGSVAGSLNSTNIFQLL